MACVRVCVCGKGEFLSFCTFPPNEIIFTSLQCHGIISSLSKRHVTWRGGGEWRHSLQREQNQATQRFCFFFCLHTHTHTHVLVKSITHSGRYTMPLHVPQGLVTRSSVLHALCDMSSTRRTGPIVCAWIGGGGGCVCERELKAFGVWMQAAVNPVLE